MNFLNDKFRQKLELTTVGFLFTFLGMIMTKYGYPIVSMFFYIVSAVFYIRALSIRNKK